MRRCRCIKTGKGGFHPGWMYPFEEDVDGSITVDDPPAFSFRFKDKLAFAMEFVEVNSAGDALISEDMLWKTENGREIPVANMTSDHILNCLKWIGFGADMDDVKDGFTVREWLHSFSKELENRKQKGAL